MLTAEEISQASADCGGCGIIILTRAFWPNHPWRTNVEAVLDHPKLYGVAMEFNPMDAGKRNEDDFVDIVTTAGKSPFFLLPLGGDSPELPSAEERIRFAINAFVNMGTNMGDSRVRVVVTRYDAPHLPVAGKTNSVQAALKEAQ